MKNIILLLMACLLLSTGSCKKDPLNATMVIHFLKPDPETSPADNLTTLAITAVLPADSDPQTLVTFTTDLGTFVNSNSTTITVSADALGKATVSIKSAITGTATIKATVATKYTAVKTVNFTAPSADNIFTVAAYTDNVTADGITTMILTAAINKSLPTSAQSVVFAADNGATFSNNTSNITVPADGAGNAIAYLKKAAEGPVHVTMTGLGVTRNLTVNFVAPNADNVFTISPFTDNIMADGVSAMTLTAAVNKRLPVVSQIIAFTADNSATFSNNTGNMTINADGAGNAIAYLKKTAEGPVHVTMTGLGITRSLTVNFTRSVPDNMLLTNNPSVSSGFGNNLVINISLQKNIGKPATGYLFVYSATDSDGNPVGVFSNGTASDANGVASVNFTTGSSTYKGIVNITIALRQNPGISQTTSVLVN
ncbi:hypothetical protein VB264_15440 [Arcicella aquatica]|uniref:Big-1 domain-containing protein n=1 Tax=Arcicella aquatica TaxID=217141 RepID=A0ABU5QR83_9BACT|nr:hypothetical protein [Arcicella aquatica]MEA5259189.1 hypothetical protein [Arcicella aquatica]